MVSPDIAQLHFCVRLSRCSGRVWTRGILPKALCKTAHLVPRPWAHRYVPAITLLPSSSIDMAFLLDLAPETIVNIIRFLDIYSLLQFEQVRSCYCRYCLRAADSSKTSKYLRSVTLSRPVWDTQVANLDHTCAPNLPPSTNIEKLSAEQLRRIVIEAVQIRDSWTKGPSPSVHLEKKQIIVRNPAASVSPILPPSFFPGGRFLAVWDSRRLRVVDLHDGGRLVWAYDLASDVQHDQNETIEPRCYGVGMLEDGTLVVAHCVSATENDGTYCE